MCPGTTKYVQGAHVFRGQILAGRIGRTENGAFFEYDPEFLKRSGNVGGIAFHLPYAQRRIETTGTNLHPFFAGLLPEGARMRALTQRLKTSDNDFFTLLLATGVDCIGDLAIGPEGLRLPEINETVDSSELGKTLFQELLAKSLEYRSGGSGPSEASLPGTQEKISASTLLASQKSRKSQKGDATYILKLASTGKPQVIENEAFFRGMAKACGLDVAEAEVVRDRNGVTGLLVKRFDRRPSNEGLVGVHQEDACQFLDRYPSEKYQISYAEVAEGLQKWCTSPPVEITKFLRLVAFSYLIGNGDLHAKNVSVFVDPITGRVALTPLYDLMSTQPYGASKMALSFDGRTEGLSIAHFLNFASRYRVPERVILAALKEIVDEAPAWIERVGEIGLDEKKTRALQLLMRARREELAH